MELSTGEAVDGWIFPFPHVVHRSSTVRSSSTGHNWFRSDQWLIFKQEMSESRAKLIIFAHFQFQEQPVVDCRIGSKRNTWNMHNFPQIWQSGCTIFCEEDFSSSSPKLSCLLGSEDFFRFPFSFIFAPARAERKTFDAKQMVDALEIPLQI